MNFLSVLLLLHVQCTCTVYMYVYLFANKTLTWLSEISSVKMLQVRNKYMFNNFFLTLVDSQFPLPSSPSS